MSEQGKLDFEAQKAEFLRICKENITREGIDNLIDWLVKSDFFSAPASTRFHGAYAGGLCQHCLDVYNYSLRVAQLSDKELNLESLTIAALFHDLCKVNFYKPDFRNQKIDGQWQQVPFFSIEEKFHFGGHGSKSMFIASHFMKLTNDEAVAINCHMGFGDGANVSSVSDAFGSCTLAWVIHVADEAATYLLDR